MGGISSAGEAGRCSAGHSGRMARWARETVGGKRWDGERRGEARARC